ncbi:MAG TPA: ribbon-helix-helix protein, CopG family [Gemmatimonadales bacterium]|nr:ribbon-helix-helix protein, CopG family [Gemmatimonadales bacterium]
MKRTTIFLDEATERRLREAARRSGRPMAGMVREALVAYLDVAGSEPASLPSIAGRFSSGTTDTSERVDDLLWDEPHS